MTKNQQLPKPQLSNISVLQNIKSVVNTNTRPLVSFDTKSQHLSPHENRVTRSNYHDTLERSMRSKKQKFDRYHGRLRSLAFSRKRELRDSMSTQQQRFTNSAQITELNMQGAIDYVLPDLKGAYSGKSEQILDFLEDVGFFTYSLIRSRTYADYGVAALNFLKLRLKSSILARAKSIDVKAFIDSIRNMEFDDMPGLLSSDEEDLPELRMQGDFGDEIATAREALDYWPRLRKSSLWRRVRLIITYVTSLTLWDKSNNHSNLVIKIEREQYHTKSAYVIDMTYALVDLLLFLVERGHQCCKTGTFDPIFHTGGTYEAWYNDASELLAKGRFLCNPVAHNIDVHAFIKKCVMLIEKGECMYKYAAELDSSSKKIIASTLHALRVLQADDINRRSAQSMRRAPLTVNIFGHSSVAKTTFGNVLHVVHNGVRGKDTTSASKYVHNALAKFYDGFTSDVTTIVIDDAASENPNKCPGMPPSLVDFLNISNNTPLVFDMASLENKGSAPCLAEQLIITTNSPDLHAATYFACKVAVMRRFEYFFHIQPKKEYIRNTVMIDPSKLETPEPGCFPDYWDISVYTTTILEPQNGLFERQFHCGSKFKLVRKFTDIVNFTQWYAQSVTEYHAIQDKILLGDVAMSSIKMCSSCFRTERMCTCNDSVFKKALDSAKEGLKLQGASATDWSFPSLKTYGLEFLKWYLWSCFIQFFYLFTMNFCSLWQGVFQHWAYDVVSKVTVTEAKARLRALGDTVQKDLMKPSVLVLLLIGVLTTIVATRFAWSSGPELTNQGNTISFPPSHGIVGSPPPISNDKESAWIKPDLEITAFEFSRKSLSWKGLTPEEVTQQLFRNCVSLNWKVSGRIFTSMALCIGGQYFMVANHTVPDGSTSVQVIAGRDGSVTPNVTMTVSPEDIRRFPEKDICIVRLRNLPNRKSIIDLFADEELIGYRGPAQHVGRDRKGALYSQPIKAVYYDKTYYNNELQSKHPMYFGTPSNYTENGMCGSALLAHTLKGPVILGIHELGSVQGVKLVGAIQVTKQWLSGVMEGHSIVQPSIPLMDTPTTEKCVLSNVNDKSPALFLNGSTMSIHGGLLGFRSTPKSKVQTTLLCSPLNDLGYSLNHGPPVMNGWRPWYRALSEMGNADATMKDSILQVCKEQLLDQWLSIDTKWYDELRIYDLFTVVNGCPGVKFVDKINRNTSAGNPWRKSKKFLISYLAPQKDVQIPIEFDDEVIARVHERLDNYVDGYQTHPVFTASLKDEAVTFKKIENFKTRVFMGSSIDFTIVMRMLLLSFTRVVQMNSFTFESAPGINAHSCAWEGLYKHITHFGTDRMIFGDFKDYDISMRSHVIIHAFEVIEDFHRRSGASEIHCTMIRTLAYDIAFALVDYNGTLITLFGKNPSGQALTVIINGIVNCLYLRYCYISLHPDFNLDYLTMKNIVWTFPKNVRLITYGDDNGQGVSSDISWYNHTSIQGILSLHGITFTMAEKERASVPYIDISEADFLKRKFRFDKDIGHIVGPLEFNSITKMLMIGVNQALSKEEQVVAVIRSAMQELFYHGKDVFEEWDTKLRRIVTDLELDLYFENSDRPSWYTLYERFVDSAEHLEQQGCVESCLCGHDDCEIIASPDELRLCRNCSRCRFDDYDLNCIFCGWNDTCELCAQPSTVFIGNDDGQYSYLCDHCWSVSPASNDYVVSNSGSPLL